MRNEGARERGRGEGVYNAFMNTNIFVGGDNVFADLGLPNAEERQAKAEIAIMVEKIIDDSHLTQSDAARRMGLTQPEVSLIVRGRLKGFTLERLLQGLLALDQDVDIIVRPKRLTTERAHLQVAYAEVSVG